MVRLDALTRNYARLRAMTPNAETSAVVKADAYGLDAGRIGPTLMTAGCRSFFTATANEGAALRAAVGDGPAIHVLNGYWPAERALYADAKLTAILNSPEEIAAFADNPPGASALHVDTGMNRLGVSVEAARALAGDPDLQKRIGLRLIMSHLACSDVPDHPMNAAQHERFAAVAALFEGVKASLANSGGVLLGEEYHFDLTRPGIALYGGSPVGDAPHPFEPVFHIAAPLLQLRRLKPGETVGYGATWTAERETVAATVALGYADGLMRAAQGGGFARIGGRKAPIIGRVSMDLCVVDVTGLDEAARPGGMARFFGEDLEGLASAAGTIGYELIARLGRRFSRRYEGL